MTCPLECCKKYEEYTEQDTNIDSVSLSVVETHKTKPKKPTIPPSLCCPICWCSLIKCLCRVCLPTIRATDVHEQDVFHHSGTETTNVYYMPNSDMNSLLRTWLMCGLFGGHLFKAGRFKEGACRVVLWCLIAFIIVGLIGAIVAGAVIAGGDRINDRCPENSYCPSFSSSSCIDLSECEACPAGKFSRSGSGQCTEYFVATSGQCEDVQGGVTITDEHKCKSALIWLTDHDYNDLCIGCAQSSMPRGCLDYGGHAVLNTLHDSDAECGKRVGISNSKLNIQSN